MADPSDRPPPAPVGGAQPRPESYPARKPAPPPEFGRDGADGATYRPLSLAAIVGFSLAVLFAAGLLLVLVAAWFNGLPLPLALWVLLAPLAALVVSGVGWLRVQQSEGTLAGGRLAVWGVALSVFAGLAYGAYLVASAMALGSQAEAFAGQWLDKIRQGELDQAFLETLPPENRPPRKTERLHAQLELRFNVGRDGSFGGEFGTFEKSELVRAVNHSRGPEGGADTQIRPRGVKNTEAKSNGYVVEMTFEVSTPERVLEILVTANGTDTKAGRQWHIDRDKTRGLRMVEPRPRNDRVMELQTSSNAFVTQWLSVLGNGDLQEAYLRTQPPGRRATLTADLYARLIGATLAPDFSPARVLPLSSPALTRAMFLPGYGDFADGALVQVGPDFWAEGPAREEIPIKAREALRQPREEFAPFVLPDPATSLPLWLEKDGRVRFYHLFQVQLFHAYIVQGAFVAETDASALDDAGGTPNWRLAGIELYNGRSLVRRRP